MDPHAHEQATNITSARPGRSVDLHRRQMRYLYSMGLRTVCFVAAVIASGPLRWTFVAAAIILPYIAVVFANSASQGTATKVDEFRTEPIASLKSGDSRGAN